MVLLFYYFWLSKRYTVSGCKNQRCLANSHRNQKTQKILTAADGRDLSCNAISHWSLRKDCDNIYY